jgi:hypothetical protein
VHRGSYPLSTCTEEDVIAEGDKVVVGATIALTGKTRRAIRSIFGCWRVTHFIASVLIQAGSRSNIWARRVGATHLPTRWPPSEGGVGRRPSIR